VAGGLKSLRAVISVKVVVSPLDVGASPEPGLRQSACTMRHVRIQIDKTRSGHNVAESLNRDR